jgi:hypothetical protein
MKKYEAKLIQAKDNFQHIAQEVSMIWAQFAAIWHEMKEIVTKISHEDSIWEQSSLLSNTPEQVSSVQIIPMTVANAIISPDVLIQNPVVSVWWETWDQAIVINSFPSI